MGSINATGDTHADISTIIDQLNTVNESIRNSNQLNLASYGVIRVVYTGGAVSLATENRHNLGYPPFFLLKNVTLNSNSVPATVKDVFVLSNYSYAGNTPKINSGYVASIVQPYVTNNTIGVVFNIPPSGIYPAVGTYLFQYYLFSNPIGQKS